MGIARTTPFRFETFGGCQKGRCSPKCFEGVKVATAFQVLSMSEDPYRLPRPSHHGSPECAAYLQEKLSMLKKCG